VIRTRYRDEWCPEHRQAPPYAKGVCAINENILIVDDDPTSIQLMGRILSGLANLRFATNGTDAVRLVHESPPDLILLDAELPGMSGFKVLDALKADVKLSEVPVIFVTGHTETPFEVSALDMGAADFIAKPVRASLLVARVKTHLRMKRMADELRRTATTDGLTGVANRRHFDDMLEREWWRSCRSRDPLALLIVDVDHFKLYNDRYGHPQGDICLQNVAQALTNTLRRSADLVARYGGEEFGVVLPQTMRSGAEHMAQRMLDAVAALAIPHSASATAPIVSVSIGVACYDDANGEPSKSVTDLRLGGAEHIRSSENDLILAADSALYSAKHAGRARAMLLDVADVASPHLVREIERCSYEFGEGAWA
jgi:diguanylate cyclase (GGDEF)-like protein